MPENGLKRTPTTEYGSVGRANAAAQRARPAPEPSPRQAQMMGAQPGQAPLEPQNDIEAGLFGPTRLPDQPITAGAPFGPGPMGIPPASADDRLLTFVRSLATDDAPDEVRSFADRLERGE